MDHGGGRNDKQLEQILVDQDDDDDGEKQGVNPAPELAEERPGLPVVGLPLLDRLAVSQEGFRAPLYERKEMFHTDQATTTARS